MKLYLCRRRDNGRFGLPSHVIDTVALSVGRYEAQLIGWGMSYEHALSLWSQVQAESCLHRPKRCRISTLSRSGSIASLVLIWVDAPPCNHELQCNRHRTFWSNPNCGVDLAIVKPWEIICDSTLSLTEVLVLQYSRVTKVKTFPPIS
jgi:hypothetical protein